MFDEAVSIGKYVLETLETVCEIKFAIPGYGFIEVDHKAFANGYVFDVHNWGIGSHCGEDVIESRSAGIDLSQGFEVVHIIQDQT